MTELMTRTATPSTDDPAAAREREERDGLYRRDGQEIRLRADTWDAEARTVEVVAAAGATVTRYDWRNGGYYDEELVVDEAAVTTSREQVPLLDAHSRWQMADQIGHVTNWRVENGELIATVRLYEGIPGADAVAAMLSQGGFPAASVGYRAVETSKQERDGQHPLVRITQWNWLELSFVPIGADAAAGARHEPGRDGPDHGGTPHSANNRPQQRGSAMEDDDIETPVETGNEGQRSAAAPATPPAAAPAPQDEAQIRAQERERVRGIQTACTEIGRFLGTDGQRTDLRSVADRFVESGESIEATRSALWEEMSRLQERDAGTIRGGAAVEVGQDLGAVGFREGLVDAILHVRSPQGNEVPDRAREHMPVAGRQSLQAIAQTVLQRHGGNPVRLTSEELFRAVVSRPDASTYSRAGEHVISDFSFIAGTLVNRTLRMAYEAAPQTFRPWATTGVLRDFRAARRVQVGIFPALQELPEGAEIKFGTVGESGETVQLVSYARGINLSRQLFINDDLMAFMRIIQSAGTAASNLESDLVYAQLTGNPVMADNTALFDSDHGNLAAASDLDTAAIGGMRALMRKQTALDGKTLLNITPRFLLVPPSKETKAQQFTSQAFQPDSPGNVNPFAGSLTPIAEPRLTDTDSDAAFYLVGDPAQVDTIELARLEGQNGVDTRQEESISTLGLKWVAFEDVTAKAIDHRGFAKTPHNPA